MGAYEEYRNDPTCGARKSSFREDLGCIWLAFKAFVIFSIIAYFAEGWTS